MGCRPRLCGSPRSLPPTRLSGTRLLRFDLAEVGWLIRGPRYSSEGEYAHALRTGEDPPARAWPDAHDRLGVERDALSLDLDLRVAAKHHVDLLLPVLAVAVFGVLVEVRRELLDLHAKGSNSELGAREAHATPERRLHLVNPLHAVARHLDLLRRG